MKKRKPMPFTGGNRVIRIAGPISTAIRRAAEQRNSDFIMACVRARKLIGSLSKPELGRWIAITARRYNLHL